MPARERRKAVGVTAFRPARGASQFAPRFDSGRGLHYRDSFESIDVRGVGREHCGMDRASFHIGLEFWSDGRRYRCTDVGSRVVVAIRVDCAQIMTFEAGSHTTRQISGEQADAEGWFSGPPYGVVERVFDEDDLEGCSLERGSD